MQLLMLLTFTLVQIEKTAGACTAGQTTQQGPWPYRALDDGEKVYTCGALKKFTEHGVLLSNIGCVGYYYCNTYVESGCPKAIGTRTDCPA